MKFEEIFIFLFSLFSVTCAKEVTLDCCYSVLNQYRLYECSGRRTGIFREGDSLLIIGNHLTQKSDENVQKFEMGIHIYEFEVIPGEIQEKFQNLVQFEFVDSGVKNITNNSFTNCNNLTTIFLHKNKLEEIPANSFVHCRMLTELRLDVNPISKINDEAFIGLESLQELDLSNNKINEITRNIFKPLESLTKLKLSGNAIRIIQPEAFRSLQNLKELILSNNKISFLNQDSFISCHALEVLMLNNNQFSSFQSGFLEPLKNLKTLDISFNRLNRLISKDFRTLTSLTQFKATDASIDAIEVDLFVEMLNLTHVDLRNNICFDATIQENSNELMDKLNIDLQKCFSNFENSFCEYFYDNENLYSCKLSAIFSEDQQNEFAISGSHFNDNNDENVLKIQTFNSRLELLPSVISRKFPNVKKLNLWNVQLHRLVQNEFENLKHLTTLDLRLNHISNIIDDWFQYYVPLKQLILIKNEIEEIGENSFSGLVDLNFLDLSFNKLVSVPYQAFKNLSNLRSLYLNKNFITELTDDNFDGLIKLRILRLAGNEIEKIAEKSFQSLQNLREIQMQDNKISNLPIELFSFCVKLEYVNLEHNQLTHFTPKYFTNSLNLNYLDLSSNKIQIIRDREEFMKLKQLSSLFLSNNECFDENYDDFYYQDLMLPEC